MATPGNSAATPLVRNLLNIALKKKLAGKKREKGAPG
jgi:hypothetical protein